MSLTNLVPTPLGKAVDGTNDNKTITYVVITVISALVVILADNKVTEQEWLNLAIVAVGTVLVYYTTAAKALKTILTFALAALQALATIWVSGGIQDVPTSSWLQVALAAFAGIGVFLTRESPLDAITKDANGVIHVNNNFNLPETTKE